MMTENMNDKSEVDKVGDYSLEDLSGILLEDARNELSKSSTMTVPTAELPNLGSSIGMILPYINCIDNPAGTGETLYRIANSRPNDSLKAYKGGYAPYYQGGGTGSMAVLEKAGGSAGDLTAVLNPATMMMAVALYTIESQLEDIAESQKQILSFLEIEKESEIEANVETLINILHKYKNNWDNQKFLASNHKMVLDIQKESRTNIIGFQKKVNDIIGSKQFLVASKNVNSTLKNLEKKFKYYKLSLYTFALSSFLEIMLSGNFNENYIAGIRDEIRKMSMDYRELFGKSSLKLENLSNSAIDTVVMKGLGTAGTKVGSMAKSLPRPGFNKNKHIRKKDEKLKREIHKDDKTDKSVKAFASLSNPGTGPITDRMDDIINIYNHTDVIYFDKDNIYLALDANK